MGSETQRNLETAGLQENLKETLRRESPGPEDDKCQSNIVCVWCMFINVFWSICVSPALQVRFSFKGKA